jgi:signal peptidase I
MDFLEGIRNGENEAFEWFYFLSLALILAFGTITFTGTVFDTERPVVSVVSCSMYPEYGIGDILIVEGQEFSDIEENDILVYNVPDRAEFSIDGERYILEKDSPYHNTTAETSLGTVELVGVIPNLEDNEADDVILSVDGQRIKFKEESSARGIEVEDVHGMPIPVVHRVVEKSDDSLETAGDANSGQLDFESNVRPFQVYGTSFFRIPKIGAVKILAMDLAGYGAGDRPIGLDRKYVCP